MNNQGKKFRPGMRASEFPPVPSLLHQKTFKKINILVGDDPAQVRFAEQVLATPCRSVDIINDEDVLLGSDQSQLFRVETARVIDLSTNVRSKAAIWSLDPIVSGGTAANALLKFAAELLGKEKLDRKVLDGLGKELLRDDSEDVRMLLWKAVWLLTNEKPTETAPWTYPWKDAKGWLPKGENPAYRLNSLYKDLVGYVLLQKDEDSTFKKAGLTFSPSKQKVLKSLKLDWNKVHDTIYELSRWRTERYDPYICAFRILTIWQPILS